MIPVGQRLIVSPTGTIASDTSVSIFGLMNPLVGTRSVVTGAGGT
jgi:hypothetical protein